MEGSLWYVLCQGGVRMKTKCGIFLMALISIFTSCGTDFTYEAGQILAEQKTAAESDTEEELDFSLEKEDDAYEEESLNRWTVLVYMAADNNLESAGISDFNELENADISDDVTVLVLFDRSEDYDATNGNWTGTRLYRIRKDRQLNRAQIASEQLDCPELGLKTSCETELDMANPLTLSGFCEYAWKYFPAEHYALIVWGHGSGWRGADNPAAIARAVAIDDNSSSYMVISQLRSAIQAGMNMEKLSVIGFDTCFGMSLECAYELSDCADYMLGTPALVSESGWNYTEIMNQFSKSEESCRDFIEAVCSNYTVSYENYGHASFSCVDLSKIPAFVADFSDYSLSLSSSISTEKRRDEIFTIFTDSCLSYCDASYPTDFYVDVGDALSLLEPYYPSALVRDSLADCMVSSWSASGDDVSLALFFCVYQTKKSISPSFPSMYKSGSREPLLSRFVRDCTGYVPSEEVSMTSLLDKLFYGTF